MCGLALRQNLLLASLAMAVCSNENCVYPLNMTMEEIQQNRLMVRVSDQDIIAKMLPKLAVSQVDDQVASFMVKEDDTLDR